jgi:hypothetical protein
VGKFYSCFFPVQKKSNLTYEVSLVVVTSEIVGVGIGIILKFSINVGGVEDVCCIRFFYVLKKNKEIKLVRYLNRVSVWTNLSKRHI